MGIAALRLVFWASTLVAPLCGSELANAAALTPEHFRELIETYDDALDVRATFSTERGLPPFRAKGVEPSDNFVSAVIDKKTGATTIYITQAIAYSGEGWRFYRSANYLTAEGPEEADTTLVDRKVGRCYRLSCVHVEQVTFTIPETVARWVAAKHRPDFEEGWEFKLLSDGPQWRDFIFPSEMGGLLLALDDYRARHPELAPKASPASSPGER